MFVQKKNSQSPPTVQPLTFLPTTNNVFVNSDRPCYSFFVGSREITSRLNSTPNFCFLSLSSLCSSRIHSSGSNSHSPAARLCFCSAFRGRGITNVIPFFYFPFLLTLVPSPYLPTSWVRVFSVFFGPNVLIFFGIAQSLRRTETICYWTDCFVSPQAPIPSLHFQIPQNQTDVRVFCGTQTFRGVWVAKKVKKRIPTVTTRDIRKDARHAMQLLCGVC